MFFKTLVAQSYMHSSTIDPPGGGASVSQPLLSTLKTPIKILSAVQTFGFDGDDMLQLKKGFHQLLPDVYLQRQKSIESAFFQKDMDPFWEWISQYYTGEIDTKQFFQHTGITLSNLGEPTRYRGVSSFTVGLGAKGNVTVEQREPILFCQPEAMRIDGSRDLRVIPRRIPDLPPEHINEPLKRFITHSSEMVFEAVSAKKLIVTLHHMRVVSRNKGVASNSPEGAHQDGMDYIVSAFVINRENVVGGESIIYGADKSTKIVEVLLEEGMGLFQPDKGTDLWHEVAAITPVQLDMPAVRDIIGVDFSVVG